MGFEDHVSRSLALIVADDRRPPEDQAAVERLWREEFKSLPGDRLEKAVRVWLKENPRGRPNIGKLQEILERLYPTTKTTEKTRWEDERRHELLWACSVLQNPEPFQGPNYRHTLEYAEKCLKRHQFSSWESAMQWLEPGWTPPVTETYL